MGCVGAVAVWLVLVEVCGWSGGVLGMCGALGSVGVWVMGEDGVLEVSMEGVVVHG